MLPNEIARGRGSFPIRLGGAAGCRLSPYSPGTTPSSRTLRHSRAVLFGNVFCHVQPTTDEARSLQPADHSGHSADGVPEDPRFVVRDHAQDRPLIVTEIIVVDPAQVRINAT